MPGGFVEDTSDAAVAANRVEMAKAYCASLGRTLLPGTFRCGALPAPPAPEPPTALKAPVAPNGGG